MIFKKLFKKSKGYPPIVYKYRNWSDQNNKNVLLKNELFLTPPSGFNDPFDCKIFKNYNLLNSPKKIERYASDLNSRIGVPPAVAINRLSNIESYQKEREVIEVKAMDIHFGILSMSSRWNSILMWSHYADLHRGYCIGFNESKMRNSGFFGRGGKVVYSNEYPIIDPLKDNDSIINSHKQTHYKAKEWRYEKEYRLTNIFQEPPTSDDRKVKVPDHFIEEVNLGVNMQKCCKKVILAVCRSKNLKVFQLKKVPFQFKLIREEITF